MSKIPVEELIVDERTPVEFLEHSLILLRFVREYVDRFPTDKHNLIKCNMNDIIDRIEGLVAEIQRDDKEISE